MKTGAAAACCEGCAIPRAAQASQMLTLIFLRTGMGMGFDPARAELRRPPQRAPSGERRARPAFN